MARLYRQLMQEEERAERRLTHLLRALELDESPMEQGRRSAERMWNEIQARYAGWHEGREWVTIRRR